MGGAALTRFRPGSGTVAAAAMLGLVSLRPLVSGAEPLEVLAFAAFLAVYVLLPGAIVARRVREPADDVLDGLAAALAIGFALQALVFALLAAAGAQHLFLYTPVLLVPFLRRAPSVRAATPGPLVLVALCVLLVAAVTRSTHRPPALWWTTYESDAYFHAGNVAELARCWPLVDPRIAGEPLNYHFFAYALPAAANRVLGVPVLEVVDRLTLGLMPAVLALVLFVAGRRYAGSAIGGVCAAAAIVLHEDLGEAGPLASWMDLRFLSPLAIGVYGSMSTVFGLVLLAALATVLHRWWSVPLQHGRSHAALAALFGFVAAGAKGSVMPIVLGGIGFTWIVVVWQQRATRGRALAALFVLSAVALPMTAALALGERSYASSMFRVLPGLALRTSSFTGALATRSGFERFEPPAWFLTLVSPLWLAGYLGLAGLGGVFFVVLARRRWTTAEVWCLATACCGVALALVLAAPGYSQLFFAYGGQVTLAIVGGGGFAAAFALRSRARVVAWVATLAVALPTFALALATRVTVVTRAHAHGPPESVRVPELLQGIDWIREHAPDDVVLVVRSRWLQLSVRAERRVLDESESFSPALYVQSAPNARGVWKRPSDAESPYARRAELAARLFEAPDVATLEELGAVSRASGPIWAVVERALTVGSGPAQHVEVERVEDADLAPFANVGRIVFRNEALAVVELGTISSR
jgi:hypothetical protein